MLMGSFALGQAVPNRQAISCARGFARKMFATIERRSAIDPASEAGERPGRCTGELELRDVHFSYPSRPTVEVLRGLSLTVGAGQTVGLVGASGSGKSTVVALLERFYDPSAGRVLLDGRDVRELNVRWLREQIGLVLQEPVLFDTSVAQNIAYGRAGATQYEVERAGRLANAHDFIMELPEKYATRAGQGGAELSGGQKQRIAIARARWCASRSCSSSTRRRRRSTPRARAWCRRRSTSCCRRGRCTMVVIAHRLSTVRRATKIAVVDGGRLVEEGTHDELLARPDSRYAAMLRMKEDDGGAGSSKGGGAMGPEEERARAAAERLLATVDALAVWPADAQTWLRTTWRRARRVCSRRRRYDGGGPAQRQRSLRRARRSDAPIYELLLEGDCEGHLRRLGLEGVPAAKLPPPPCRRPRRRRRHPRRWWIAEIIVDDTMPPAGAAIRPPPSARAASEVFSSRSSRTATRARVGMWRVAALSAPDAGYVALGLGACVLNGLVMPASALCFVEMVAVFYDTDDTKMAAGATRNAVGFLVIAGGFRALQPRAVRDGVSRCSASG